MKHIRYDYWADYLYHLTSKYISPESAVLELAAGNCKLAKFLVKKYPRLIVSDLSLEMLECSDSKKLRKVCCNMVSIPFKKKFDMIYVTFDSINYLLTRKKMLLFFKEIKKILSDNGIFAFDASLERNSIRHITRLVRKAIYKKYNYVHKSSYDTKTRIHKNIFEITLPDGEVHKEIHKQKILDFNDYFDLIERAGLYVVECLDAFTFNSGKSGSNRIQFVIKKA